MTLLQVLIALSLAPIGVVLIHDFMSGLREDRIWGMPFPENMEPALPRRVPNSFTDPVNTAEAPERFLQARSLKQVGGRSRSVLNSASAFDELGSVRSGDGG